MKVPSVRTLEAELALMLRGGLPVREDLLITALPSLRIVRSRAQYPKKRFSRIKALSEILEEQLRVGLPAVSPLRYSSRDQHEVAQATAVLFGATPYWQGRNLTERRDEAARMLDYESNHFRKWIAPKLVRALAVALHELERRVADEDPGALGVRLDISEIDVTAETETRSRLLSVVFDLRACLIAARLLRREDPPEGVDSAWEIARFRQVETERLTDRALWRTAQLLAGLPAFAKLHGPLLDESSLPWLPKMPYDGELFVSTLISCATDEQSDFENRFWAAERAEDLYELWKHWLAAWVIDPYRDPNADPY